MAVGSGAGAGGAGQGNPFTTHTAITTALQMGNHPGDRGSDCNRKGRAMNWSCNCVISPVQGRARPRFNTNGTHAPLMSSAVHPHRPV